MKFEEVLPALRDGKKIRLKRCEDFKYLFKPKNDSELKTEDYHNINLSWKDVFSDDWEIIKEKKVKLRDLTEEQFKEWRNRHCGKYDCFYCPFRCIDCNKEFWISCKDMYSDKFLDQEVEIEEEV